VALKGRLGSVECLSLGGNKLNDKSAAILASLNPELIYYLKLCRIVVIKQEMNLLIRDYHNCSKISRDWMCF
jgi:hypothetical protein